MFRQRVWMIPLAYISGMLGIVLGIYLIANNYVPWYYLFVWIAGHVILGMFVSVGLHRYFSHGSFIVNKFWHTVLAVCTHLGIHGSPQAWAAAHTTHHDYADTPKDFHKVSLSYLIWKSYNNVPMSLWRLKDLSHDPILKLTHRYSLVIIVTFALMLYLINPMLLLFGYLMPIGSVHFTGAVHQTTTHKHGIVKSMPYMEWVLPASGEWLHKYHHDNPGSAKLGTKWYHLDLGYLFINLIRTKG